MTVDDANLARLVVERRLGEGGMGTVDLVVDRRLGRRAALKKIKEGQNVARFLREVRITARLDHPGIPPVYEAGRSSAGEVFLLMRFVAGEPLDAILRAGTMPLEERVRILVKVGEAVAYAHEQRVIHRDLKPANVMVGKFGEVLVMDWGIARDLAEAREMDAAIRRGETTTAAAGATEDGAMLGTLGYAAPEQVFGGADVDGRADVFALGATLVEVITGKPPIEGASNANRLKATLDGRIVLPRARVGDCPPELDAIAARALAVAPTDRYESMSALVADLRAWVEGREVSVYRYGVVERARRLVKRYPGFVAAATLALVVSSAAAAVVTLKNRELGRTLSALEKETRDREQAQKDIEKTLRAHVLVLEAQNQLNRGKPKDEILRALDEAVALWRTEQLLLTCAGVARRIGDVKKARELLERCATEFPPGYEALHQLHIIDRDTKTGGRDHLAEILRRARARGEENELTILAEASDALYAKDFARALALAERVIAGSPGVGTGYFVRAQARIALKDLGGALADADRLLELERATASNYLLRGWIHQMSKNFPAALEDFTRVIDLEPDRQYGWFQRGYVRLVTGDANGALADLQRCVELAPEYADGWFQRGRAHDLKAERAKAIADYEKYLELVPDSPDAENIRKRIATLEAR